MIMIIIVIIIIIIIINIFFPSVWSLHFGGKQWNDCMTQGGWTWWFVCPNELGHCDATKREAWRLLCIMLLFCPPTKMLHFKRSIVFALNYSFFPNKMLDIVSVEL